MIALMATVAGCVHTDEQSHPKTLHGRWERTVTYPALTVHSEVTLASDGSLNHSAEARLLHDGDTICYMVTASGRWFLQRSVNEFRLLQAEYAPASITREVKILGRGQTCNSYGAVTEAGRTVLSALPPTWDSFDAYLLESPAGQQGCNQLHYPLTLLELTDTTSSTLTGMGAYSTVVRLSRMK